MTIEAPAGTNRSWKPLWLPERIEAVTAPSPFASAAKTMNNQQLKTPSYDGTNLPLLVAVLSAAVETCNRYVILWITYTGIAGYGPAAPAGFRADKFTGTIFGRSCKHHADKTGKLDLDDSRTETGLEAG
jgi:hypothetical protein